MNMMRKQAYLLTNLKNMKIQLFLFLSLLLSSFVLVAQSDSSETKNNDLFSYENSKKYAEYLSLSGQYDAASNEYLRLLSINEDNEDILTSLSFCYIQMGKPDIATSTLNILYPNLSLMPKKTKTDYAKLMLIDENYDGALKFTSTYVEDEKDKEYIQLYSLLFTANWQNAAEFNNSLTHNSFSREQLLIDKGLNLKLKSPFLAGFMSGIVPGSGKFYTKNWKDGLISTIMIAGLGWQSYRSFSTKGVSSAYGWITAGLSFGFYIGNIYGSVKAAKKYNKQKNHLLIHEAKDLFLSDF